MTDIADRDAVQTPAAAPAVVHAPATDASGVVGAGATEDVERRPITARLVSALVAIILFTNIVLFIAFLLLVTPLMQQRSQSSLLHQFRASLVLDSTPDLMTPPDGKPLGVLEIPPLGIEQVMVQGISSDDTKLGPGHDPSTPSPGQAGNAVVFGRSVTYGSPFSHLTDLRPGDDINVVTRQGRFTYQVTKMTQMPLGDPSVETQGTATTLTLITADQGLHPTTQEVVVGTLHGQGIQAPGPLPVPPASQQPGKTTQLGGWQWILLWGQLYLATIIGTCYLYLRRWSTAVTYLLTTPLLITFGFLFFSALSSLLPPTL